jgi:hypothetical protein
VDVNISRSIQCTASSCRSGGSIPQPHRQVTLQPTLMDNSCLCNLQANFAERAPVCSAQKPRAVIRMLEIKRASGKYFIGCLADVLPPTRLARRASDPEKHSSRPGSRPSPFVIQPKFQAILTNTVSHRWSVLIASATKSTISLLNTTASCAERLPSIWAFRQTCDLSPLPAWLRWLAKSAALKMWLGVDMPNDCRVVAFMKLETVDTGWSGRRESNPRMQLGKLPFCH